jgi:hypothetical protein
LPLFVLCLALTLYLAPLAHPAAAQAPGEWAWVGGSNALGQPTVYGVEYQFAAANTPGARSWSTSWADRQGRLWLFGGYNGVSLNDFWVFDPAQGAHGEWAWVGGSKQADEPGSYGTKYQFASANIPGGREQGASWIDQKGRFWLFGGLGPDSAGATGYLNDLWVFDPAQGAHGEWAWMGGSDTVHVASGHFNYSGQPGKYGTEYQFAAANIPGGRTSPVSWVDSDGRFRLFGGNGLGSVQENGGYLDDLWVFDPNQGAHGEWAWTGGSGNPDDNGVYGTAIYFTIDGKMPTFASARYSTPFTISSTTTVKAVAVKTGYANSAVITSVITIQ